MSYLISLCKRRSSSHLQASLVCLSASILRWYFSTSSLALPQGVDVSSGRETWRGQRETLGVWKGADGTGWLEAELQTPNPPTQMLPLR